jgi:branched-chain amino acid transport system substrate-binding protein
MKSIKKALGILILMLIAFQFQGCGDKKNIQIGFIGILSGRGSEIGIAGRNAASMAVSEINCGGGVGGRQVELVWKDTGGSPEGARAALDFFDREGISVVIGPMTSSDAKTLIPEANRRHILLVSPTVSSVDFSGIDDYFLRCTPPSSEEAKILAESAYVIFKVRTVSVLIDQSNASYTEAWYRSFQDRFAAVGGRGFPPIRVKSNSIEYAKVAETLCAGSPDGIVLVAGALDDAMICQHIRRTNSSVRIFMAGWGGAADFLSNGGKSVEGVVFAQGLDHASTRKELLDFYRRYEGEFGIKATHAAVSGYDSVAMIIFAMKKGARSADDVKRAILAQKTFSGLQGNFDIDRFGDGVRPFYLTIVKNRAFSRYK